MPSVERSIGMPPHVFGYIHTALFFLAMIELNGTKRENDEQLGELIAMIVSTIEENFELTPKCASSETRNQRSLS